MRRTTSAALALALAAACAHATTTDTDDASGREAADRHPDGGPQSTGGALPPASGTIAVPGHPLLSVSPQAMRTVGGTAKLREALAKSGDLPDADGASEHDIHEATKRFQAKHDLAQTGFADHETLRQLGLSPEDIDRTQRPRVSGPDGGDR